MEENEALKKGFNAGYWLEKNAPELSKTLQEALGNEDSPYAQGFKKGSREFMSESLMKSAHTPTVESEELDINGQDQTQNLSKESKDQDMEF